MKMTIGEIIKQIKETEEIDLTADFIETQLFDSLDIMTMVERLEAEYGCTIRGIDIIPENFANVDAIRTLVTKSGGSLDE